MTPQPTSVARSSGTSGSIFTSAFSWTTICSAKAERFMNWFIGSPPRQDSRRDMPGISLTSVFSQRFGCPVVHCEQPPQNTDKQPMTWSPGFKYETSLPAASTTPATSCPSTTGRGCG